VDYKDSGLKQCFTNNVKLIPSLQIGLCWLANV